MKYTTLYTIEILHDYFSNSRPGEIQFTPSEQCRQLLGGIKALVKTWQNKLYVLVPTYNGTQPAVALPSAAIFEFFWSPADAQFFNYTQYLPTQGKRYFSQNAIASIAAGTKYLHPLAALHNAGSAYSLGALVSNGAGDCFEALANLEAGNNLANASQWTNRGPLTYITPSQMVECQGGIVTLAVAPAAAMVQVQVFGFDHATNFPQTLLLTKNFNHAAPVQQQAIDLRGLKPGLYRIMVNGVEKFCYVDEQESWQQHLGIIHIYHNNALANSYALVDAGGEMLRPQYAIRLSPPSVIWQYKAATSAVKSLSDESGSYLFDAAAPLFTSKLPIRLQQQPYDKMMLEYNNTSPPDPLKTVLIKKLPVPKVGSFSTISKNNTTYLMATVLLHY